MTSELEISPADTRKAPGKEQQAAGVGILLQIMMLVLSFVLGHVLRRKKVYIIPEASASLLIGLIVGILANISDTETSIRGWFNFHEEFFFLFLLPPIIFQSGFSLAPKPFFSNFGAIVTFAIFGTFIASIVTGILVYLGGLLFLMYRLPFVECLMFGALISATDPVTVLSIFQELGTDVNLYALVFGESVLNDAMLLDTQAVKTILLEVPSLGRQTSGAASYSKFVSREMSKAEALLKVILSPVDSVADTYRALLPEGTPMEFQRILELKGLKKADQQSILDDFNKHGPGIKQTQIAPSIVPAAAPVAPVVPSPSAIGLIASREDVLTRAAALGRGAATTGFKRFLALTEAAKDRKDGPFRKLFNP